MPELTIAGLSARISTFIDNKNVFLDQLRDWHGGSATGGPNGDGIYPLTNGSGLVNWEPCPAKLADSVSGPATLSQAGAAAAELAASLAASHSATAEEQAAIAEAAKAAVLSSVADSQAAALAAQGYAANASTSASTAAGHASGLANAVSTLTTNTSNLANAVAAQTALSSLVSDARAEVSLKANTVATQATAVALANTTVTADKAIVLSAKADTLGFRDEADGFAYDASVRLTATTTARDVTLGYRNTAQTHANTATTQAGFSTANAIAAAASASTATTKASEADAARILAEAARDSAVEIVGADFVPITSKATKTEAEAGTSDLKWMTPLRTKDAISAFDGPVSINGAAGSSRTLSFKSSGVLRWAVQTGSQSEAGSGAGSDFALARYADGGGFLDNPVSITRSTGVVAFSKNPTIGASGPELGYRGIPQRLITGSTTLTLDDAGKHIGHNELVAGTVITIPGDVAYPVGTTIVIINFPYGTPISLVRGSGVELYVAGITSENNINRTIAANSIVSMTMVANKVWMITGAGLS